MELTNIRSTSATQPYLTTETAKHGAQIMTGRTQNYEDDDSSRLLPARPVTGASPEWHMKQTPFLKKRGLWHAILCWRQELACWLLGLVSYIVIIIVLHRFDQSQVSHLPGGITLGAVIGLLGSFGDALLVAAVGAIIGQTKWNRVRSARSLAEFCRIDTASRGPWGSLMLLIRWNGGTFAILGAITIILTSIGSNGFMQQTVHTTTVMHHTSNTSAVPAAQKLNGTGAFQFEDEPALGGDGLDPEMLSASYQGIFAPLDAAFPVTAACATGNCSWQTFQTLAICNTCEDITSHLRQSTQAMTFGIDPEALHFNTTHYALENSFELGGQWQVVPSRGLPTRYWPLLNMTTTITPFSTNSGGNREYYTVAFKDNMYSALAGILAIGPTPGGYPAQPPNDLYQNENGDKPAIAFPIAYECLLQFCIQTISANFSNGMLHEDVTSRYIDKSTTTTGYNIRPPGAAHNFTITPNALTGLSSWLNGFFDVNVMQAFITGGDSPVANSVQGTTIIKAMSNSTQGLPMLMNNIAASLTQAMRTLPYQPSGMDGLAYTPEVRYVIYWGYLSFPLALHALGVVLIILLLHDTWRSGNTPWKDNIAATLLHTFDPRAQDIAPSSNLADMNIVLRQRFVQLDQRGEYLVLNRKDGSIST